MLLALATPDHAIVCVSLGLILVLGLLAAWRRSSNEEFFLGGRQLSWFGVGLGLVTVSMPALTILSEPGEVWIAGPMNLFGRLLAIPCAMWVVFFFIVPFLTRLRYASVYEYLEARFGRGTRRLGALLFIALSLAWMGFVTWGVSRLVARSSGFDLTLVMAAMTLVATLYAVTGGLRAVVWTGMLQAVLLLVGAALCIAFVAWTTKSFIPDWYQSLVDIRAANQVPGMAWYSFSPFEQSTVATVALGMFVWHICNHSGNQMTMQRYAAVEQIDDAPAAFVTASVLGVVLNLLLFASGLAILHLYTKGGAQLPEGLQPLQLTGGRSGADDVFADFLTRQLPVGWAGMAVTALLAMAMSIVGAGGNSLATVFCAETTRSRTGDATALDGTSSNLLPRGQFVTIVSGLVVLAIAFGLDRLSPGRNPLEIVPGIISILAAPLGGMFLIGIFLPFVSSRAMFVSACLGLLSAVGLAFAREVSMLPSLVGLGLPPLAADISFTWVMPASLWVMVLVATGLSFLDDPLPQQTAGLTWFTRDLAPVAPAEPEPFQGRHTGPRRRDSLKNSPETPAERTADTGQPVTKR